MLRNVGFGGTPIAFKQNYRDYKVGYGPTLACAEIIDNNLRALEAVLRFCAAEGIKLYNIPSLLIPQAGNPASAAYTYLPHYKCQIARIGEYAKRNNIRLCMHLPLSVQIVSEDAKVYSRSKQEIAYHTLVGNWLGCDFLLCMHIGGEYSDKDSNKVKFCRAFRGLGWGLTRYIALENSGSFHNSDDVYEVCHELRVPMIWDLHHHLINPSRTFHPKKWISTWEALVPMIHVSSPDNYLQPTLHASYVDFEFIRRIICVLDWWDFDCLVEARQRNLAAKDFYNRYNSYYNRLR